MRPRLNADQLLDAPLLGGGIGRVVESRHPKFEEGQLVLLRGLVEPLAKPLQVARDHPREREVRATRLRPPPREQPRRAREKIGHDPRRILPVEHDRRRRLHAAAPSCR